MPIQTTLDERTAAVIRSALGEAQAGRIREACAIGERALAEHGDNAALHAMIGALLGQVGDMDAAIPHLTAALDARPGDPLIAANLAAALIGSERYRQALEVLTDDIVATDRDGRLRRLRGFAAQMSDDFPRAVADFEQVLTTAPTDWETWNNLGNTQVSAGNLPDAIAALRRAAEINPEAAPTRLNLARALRDSGDLDQAETVLTAMSADFPDDANPLIDLYHLSRSLGRDEHEAERILARAAERDPGNIDLLLELGGQQRRSLDFAKAEQTYRSAIALDPASGQAFFGLAQIFEHLRPAALPELAIEAERAGVDRDLVDLIRAFVARRAKQYSDGLKALDQIPDDVEPEIRWHLAGQMYDSSGDHYRAFEAFSRMNDANARDESEPLLRANELRQGLREQLGQMTQPWRNSWATPPLPTERPAPVFLAGFPRSGTTLLDTMLMGHPDVQVMEETPNLRKLEIEFGGFDALASLDEAGVRAAQNRYFELAGDYVDLERGSLLVDKSPLYLQRVAQIVRLFPDARFILAQRHPADVLLSCFTSNFLLNSSMANFLTLGTAAEFYDLTYKMWERSAALFAIDFQTIVYEDMITDPAAVLRPLVEKLGLAWQPEMVEHERAAEARGLIPTASYAQVTQPLYRTAAGRWKNYREQLEPILPTLRPWIEKFGYEL